MEKTTTETKIKTSTQVEMGAIRRIQGALETLTPQARHRVLTFVWGSVSEALQAEANKRTVGGQLVAQAPNHA